MEYLNENVYKTPATQHYPNQQHVTYYSYHTIVNSSALKEHIQEFRLTKCINKTTFIPAENSFVES
jgi:hypothetical protein